MKEVGIKSGDKVALSCLNVPYFPIIYYGAIIAPIDYNFKKADIASYLKESEAKAYFCFQDTLEPLIAKEGYSLPQSFSIVAFNHFRKENKSGSVGTLLQGIEIRLFDKKNHEVPAGEIGEIVIRGCNLIDEYRNNTKSGKKRLNEGPWLHTGDLGKKDEDGYIYIVDKVKNVVNRGGFEVYPKQVEKILKRHKAVSRVSVVGVPHDRHGEEIKATITLKQGKDITSSEFIEWSKANMAFYKHPRVVEIKNSHLCNNSSHEYEKGIKPNGFSPSTYC